MPRLSENQCNQAIGTIQAGAMVNDVAQHFGCCHQTIHNLNTRVLQKVLSLGSDYFSAMCYPRHTKYVVIPLTYEVCGYTPDIRSMWLYPRHTKYVVISPTYEVCGGIMFSLFRLSVRSYVRLFVHSFVRLSVAGSKFLH